MLDSCDRHLLLCGPVRPFARPSGSLGVCAFNWAYAGCCKLLLDRAALKACLSCHIFCIVVLIVLICFLDQMVRWSLGMLSGCDQQSFASLFCLAVAVSGHSCRKCHRVSDVGRPWLRQYVHALRMQTSVGRWGSPALRPCPPHSSLDIVTDALLLID